jgi:beta-galactosidase
MNAFEGKINGNRIELQRTIQLPWERSKPKDEPNRPAIGPAPDGSDPSIGSWGNFGAGLRVVLKRAER